jgi:peroxiredoxin
MTMIARKGVLEMAETITSDTRHAPQTILQPDTPAPDFSLRSTPDQFVSLNEFRGQPVILLFYPEDWSPVCSDELALFNEVLPDFERFNAQLFGISVDSAWCHLAFGDQRNLRFPLLADFHPKGEVALKYGVYRDQDGVAARALFVLDGDGVIRWSYLSPLGVSPGANRVLRALEQLYPEVAQHGS